MLASAKGSVRGRKAETHALAGLIEVAEEEVIITNKKALSPWACEGFYNSETTIMAATCLHLVWPFL
jgi:hypothetical protein